MPTNQELEIGGSPLTIEQADQELEIGGSPLTIEQVLAVADNRDIRIRLADPSRARMTRTYRYVKDTVEDFLRLSAAGKLASRDRLIYGVNTSFGALKDITMTTSEQARRLQQNIVASHAAGVGSAFEIPIIRAAMLLQAHALASGRSGVRYGVVERLVALLNRGIHPLVPEQGSVGASGDLVPLAHAALVLIGKGRAQHRGALYEGTEVEALLRDAGICDLEWKDLKLDYKEGLALVNGTYTSTALALLAYRQAETLVKHADIAACMSLEATLGHTRAFDRVVHETRPHQGMKDCAENFRTLFSVRDPHTGEPRLSSELLNRSAHVHDCYSLRCSPQVHGTVRDALRFVRETLAVEINAITDDPIFFNPEELDGSDMKPVDGRTDKLHFEEGSMHGQPVALAMDVLGIALTTIGVISERRVQMLLDKNHNEGLPAQLVNNDSGTNSGLMIAQYTAAALVAESKTLSHPASNESIPTSGNYEDHVSMAPIGGRKARTIGRNVQNILAIEFLCAVHALCFRTGVLSSPRSPNADGGDHAPDGRIRGRPAPGSLAAVEAIRPVIRMVDCNDEELHGSIAAIAGMIGDRTIATAVERAIGTVLL